jgi:hypothetical protein
LSIPKPFDQRYIVKDCGYLTPCWLYQGARWDNRYGVIHVPGTSKQNGGNRTIGAHVYAYTLRYGPIPQGQRVLHHCNVKSCVNWDHLYLGTQKKNIEDARDAGLLRPPRGRTINAGTSNAQAKLTPAQVAEMRELSIARTPRAELAGRYAVSRSQVQRILTGKRWREPALAERTDPDRFCATCGAKLERRRRPSGQLEQLTFFRKRRYCGPECRAAATRGHWSKTVEQLFWEKVDKGGDGGRCMFEGTPCALWMGQLTNQGYGQFDSNRLPNGRRHVLAHRFAWELTVGKIPAKHEVDHCCLVRRCCNSSHHQLLTPQAHSPLRSRRMADRMRNAACTVADPPQVDLQRQEIACMLSALAVDHVLGTDSVVPHTTFDVWVPGRKLAIIFNDLGRSSLDGSQPPALKNRQRDRFYACRQAGIPLLQVDEHEWANPTTREIWKSIIASKLGAHSKIGARETKFSVIFNDDAADFLAANHLQGVTPAATWCFGLLRGGNQLVGVITFSRHEKHGLNLSRLAFPRGTTVVGGAEKLLRNAMAHLPSMDIVTFSNNRYSAGTVYGRLGFIADSELAPSYLWHFMGRIWNKRRLRRNILARMLANFDPTETEHQNLYKNGARCLYDAGYQKWRLSAGGVASKLRPWS